MRPLGTGLCVAYGLFSFFVRIRSRPAYAARAYPGAARRMVPACRRHSARSEAMMASGEILCSGCKKVFNVLIFARGLVFSFSDGCDHGEKTYFIGGIMRAFGRVL